VIGFLKEGDKKDNSIKVTLSCILNILDGAIRRDGRTDLKLKVTRPNVATITRYLEYVHKQTGKPIEIDVSEDTSLATLEKLLL
jgi:ATP-dependent 26S proteasome regulatory subunit